MLTTYVVPSESGPHRKYYALNAAGRTQLGAVRQGLARLRHDHGPARSGRRRHDRRPSDEQPRDRLLLERVAAALADLPQEARDELLEDLPAHFAEVLAEQGGPLVDRLGPPAPTPPSCAPPPASTRPGQAPPTGRDSPSTRAARAACAELDQRAGRLIGYPRATEFLRLLRPAWWIARAVAIVVLIFAHRHRAGGPLRRPARLAVPRRRRSSSRSGIGATGRAPAARWIGFADHRRRRARRAVRHRQRAQPAAAVHPQDYYPELRADPFDGVTNVFPVDEQRPAAGAHHAVRPERQPDPGRRRLALHQRGRRPRRPTRCASAPPGPPRRRPPSRPTPPVAGRHPARGAPAPRRPPPRARPAAGTAATTVAEPPRSPSR